MRKGKCYFCNNIAEYTIAVDLMFKTEAFTPIMTGIICKKCLKRYTDNEKASSKVVVNA